MSAKKSWDVERKPTLRPVAQEPVAPVRASVGTRRSIPPVRRSPQRTQSASRSNESRISHDAVAPRAQPAPKVPLKVRRAKARRIFFVAMSVIGVLAVGTFFYLFWLPSLRIQDVHTEGPAGEDVARIARAELSGTHMFIVPRDSLFFIPESSIRNRILKEHPEVTTVSFKPSGLTGLIVTAVPRSSAFLWCGPSKDTPVYPCYETDPDGLVFAPAPEGIATSSTVVLRMYLPLQRDDSVVVGAHVGNASAIPNALQLAKALKSIGAGITELAIRGDEADFYTAAGTRITYVIGHERAALVLAASTFPQLHLNDGSVEYVDLRFEAKAYIRKTGEAE